MDPQDFSIDALVVSPMRRYGGRPSDGPTPFDPVAHPRGEHPTTVRVRAHKGLVGDRYFGTRFTYASVTFLATEKVRALEGELQAGPFDPTEARRNVVTRGLDVDALVRTEFTLDAGHGPIRFRSITPANPCAWLNEVFAPGAHQAFRGHAGIRCEPLDDGQLSVGPARLIDVRPLSDEELRRRVSNAPLS
ncbi:MOSC domain-containing protein [Aeromicrobium sp. CF3.5]|uniref:MOSC domain-containing protein n=1 Tax=Aeromicrobium sp. CF3.5 TaxID=3373078 RepID=UPI003EE5594E